MKTKSAAENVAKSAQQVYDMLRDLRKLENFIPKEQVQNLEVGEDYCAFEVAGIAKMKIVADNCVENSRLCYKLENDKNLPASVVFDIEPRGEGRCDLTATMELDVPIFVQGMVRGPMQKVADTAVQKIKEAAEHTN